MCACAYVSASTHGVQRRLVDPPELELQVLVSQPTQTLRTELSATWVLSKSNKSS